MVKIGVISDTHFLSPGSVSLPPKVKDVFSSVDLIYHAGDVIFPQVLSLLGNIAPIKAVRGNMDMDKSLVDLPEFIEEDIEEVKIGLIHGWGPPVGIIGRIRRKFSEDIACIVFGHTHQPMCKVVDGVLFFNPGSAVDKVFAPYNSVGILTVADGNVEGEIVEV